MHDGPGGSSPSKMSEAKAKAPPGGAVVDLPADCTSISFDISNEFRKQEKYTFSCKITREGLTFEAENRVTHDQFERVLSDKAIVDLGEDVRKRHFYNMLVDALKLKSEGKEGGELSCSVLFAPLVEDATKVQTMLESREIKDVRGFYRKGDMVILCLSISTRYFSRKHVIALLPRRIGQVQKLRLQVRDLKNELISAQKTIVGLEDTVAKLRRKTFRQLSVESVLALNAKICADIKRGEIEEKECFNSLLAKSKKILKSSFLKQCTEMSELFGWRDLGSAVLDLHRQMQISTHQRYGELPLDEKWGLSQEQKCNTLLMLGQKGIKIGNLLFKASRDGFAASSFHSKCDGRGPTVVFCRSGKCVFGGYASDWRSSGGRTTDSEAFIFSIRNLTDFGVVIFPLKDPSGNSKRYLSSYGPYWCNGSNDLYIGDNANSGTPCRSNLGYGYDISATGLTFGSTEAKNFLAGSYNFKLVEYEVYAAQKI